MSEPMDLEKANECLAYRPLEKIKKTEFDARLSLELIADALLSERRRLIEKFRPVVEALEMSMIALNIEAKERASATIEKSEKALALFHEIEKENGQ